jgi:FtsP/CotA-like multicopper oxidase with cupredoxin domain
MVFPKINKRRLSRLLSAAGAIIIVIALLFLLVFPTGLNYKQLFYKGVTRQYWIAAVPKKWNIIPTGVDGLMGQLYKPSDTTYEALIYKQYTPNWGHAMPDEYGGQPGPTIYAHVGDTIEVHFKNMDTYYNRPHSMHPHGLHYTPQNDGTYIYLDYQPGSMVPVGGTYTYHWTAEADSVGDWVYHDHSVDANNNTTLGMYGLIEVTKPGTPPPQHQMVTYFDEMTPDVTGLPNEYDTINGHAYVGNTPTYSAKVGDHVQWVVAALGSDFHVFHIHGHRWKYDGQNQDDLEIGPSEAKSVSFTEDSAGLWLVHCHVDNHMMAGMSALYKVATANGTEPQVTRNPADPTQAPGTPMRIEDSD